MNESALALSVVLTPIMCILSAHPSLNGDRRATIRSEKLINFLKCVARSLLLFSHDAFFLMGIIDDFLISNMKFLRTHHKKKFNNNFSCRTLGIYYYYYLYYGMLIQVEKSQTVKCFHASSGNLNKNKQKSLKCGRFSLFSRSLSRVLCGSQTKHTQPTERKKFTSTKDSNYTIKKYFSFLTA